MFARSAVLVLLLPVLALAQEPLNAERLRNEQYFRLIMSAVKQRFELPAGDAGQRERLRAQALIRIGPAGELLEVTLTRSSGHELFDTGVLRAVKESAPFPVPPEQLRDELKKKGVAIVFTP